MSTGGPAFPTVMIGKPEGGMTLRDYFAAKAMQSVLLLNAAELEDLFGNRITRARASYLVADLLLEEREK